MKGMGDSMGIFLVPMAIFVVFVIGFVASFFRPETIRYWLRSGRPEDEKVNRLRQFVRRNSLIFFRIWTGIFSLAFGIATIHGLVG